MEILFKLILITSLIISCGKKDNNSGDNRYFPQPNMTDSNQDKTDEKKNKKNYIDISIAKSLKILSHNRPVHIHHRAESDQRWKSAMLKHIFQDEIPFSPYNYQYYVNIPKDSKLTFKNISPYNELKISVYDSGNIREDIIIGKNPHTLITSKGQQKLFISFTSQNRFEEGGYHLVVLNDKKVKEYLFKTETSLKEALAKTKNDEVIRQIEYSQQMYALNTLSEVKSKDIFWGIINTPTQNLLYAPKRGEKIYITKLSKNSLSASKLIQKKISIDSTDQVTSYHFKAVTKLNLELTGKIKAYKNIIFEKTRISSGLTCRKKYQKVKTYNRPLNIHKDILIYINGTELTLKEANSLNFDYPRDIRLSIKSNIKHRIKLKTGLDKTKKSICGEIILPPSISKKNPQDYASRVNKTQLQLKINIGVL